MADLNDSNREAVERTASNLVARLVVLDQSLGLAREAMINAFDEAAANV